MFDYSSPTQKSNKTDIFAEHLSVSTVGFENVIIAWLEVPHRCDEVDLESKVWGGGSFQKISERFESSYTETRKS